MPENKFIKAVDAFRKYMCERWWISGRTTQEIEKTKKDEVTLIFNLKTKTLMDHQARVSFTRQAADIFGLELIIDNEKITDSFILKPKENQ